MQKKQKHRALLTTGVTLSTPHHLQADRNGFNTDEKDPKHKSIHPAQILPLKNHFNSEKLGTYRKKQVYLTLVVLL